MTKTKPNETEQVQNEWSTGSYPTLATVFLPLAARLVDAAGVQLDDDVLDVACGTGNVALTAHRRNARVTGVDITPTMLDLARKQAAVIDADVDWREGDAMALPVPDDAFDVTVSCLGHMFALDPDKAGAELLRVTKEDGRIAFISWTPGSAIAAMMVALSDFLPPDPNPSPPPFLWGVPDTVRERFGDEVADFTFETDIVRYPALSPAHFWDAMATDSGPIILALEEIDNSERAALRTAVVDAVGEYFSADHNAVELEYQLVTGRVV